MSAVLVVEDNPTIRETLGDLFVSEGYRVRLTADGAQARDALRGGLDACAVVLDLMMPVMDGWQFLEWKSASAHADVPVIVLTARNADGDIAGLAPRYGCDVLPKTGSIDALMDLLERYCARG